MITLHIGNRSLAFTTVKEAFAEVAKEYFRRDWFTFTGEVLDEDMDTVLNRWAIAWKATAWRNSRRASASS